MQDKAYMIDLGTLRGDSEPRLWHGSISLQKRLQAGEISEKDVADALRDLPDYFIATTDGAAKRCIDGSTVQNYDDSKSEWAERPLGPQIQGGSADEACACHLAGLLNGQTIIDDLDHLDDVRSSRFAPGDHTDDQADETKTGCGAVDGQIRKLALLTDPLSAPIIDFTVAKIYGLLNAAPLTESFEKLQSAARQQLSNQAYYSKPEAVLNELRALNPEGVECLVRPHAEISLTINFVKDTTFNRDHFNSRTASKIQNFNLDAWNILEEYGDNSYVLVADAVATAMDLTDGSLRLLARLAKA